MKFYLTKEAKKTIAQIEKLEKRRGGVTYRYVPCYYYSYDKIRNNGRWDEKKEHRFYTSEVSDDFRQNNDKTETDSVLNETVTGTLSLYSEKAKWSLPVSVIKQDYAKEVNITLEGE